MNMQLKPSEVIDEIGLTRDSVERVFGVTENVALTTATSMVEEFIGKDLTLLKSLIPAAEYESSILARVVRKPYQKA